MMKLALLVLGLAGMASAASVTCSDPVSNNGRVTAKCGSTTYDLTCAFQTKDTDYVSVLVPNGDNGQYIFYLNANQGLKAGSSDVQYCASVDPLSPTVSGGFQADYKQGGSCWSIGDITQQTWIEASPGQMQILIKGGTGNRQAAIYVSCDENAAVPNVTYVGENDATNTYQFEISHRSACTDYTPGDCNSAPAPTKSPSGKSGHKKTDVGAILCGVFFGVLGGYFIFGFVILHFVQKNPPSESVPNKEFWVSLPGLVRDGFAFTLARIRGQSASTYQSI
ncbi:uncharacterized protein MONBRDRAFT_10808 [Monosiga brevicollis MX1]|uniref:Autophagy-related protein 27 n=1 Tax=Monosiga brevicollis TaxID=81824 RepID=A9V7A7_MONBE|nr:uncharacterized protein MONBRDRAFT_10808 [Monosiga brevicollis MX1]EDQ86483.1 predicted protein [Monosiga brevicollis MX1]|eukprot:XP_001748596.1 hypothetical protein [Monosiga brevicollis MX1]